MIDNGTVYSDTKPEPILTLEDGRVIVSTEIQTIEEDMNGEPHTSYSYHEVIYASGEYVQ